MIWSHTDHSPSPLSCLPLPEEEACASEDPWLDERGKAMWLLIFASLRHQIFLCVLKDGQLWPLRGWRTEMKYWPLKMSLCVVVQSMLFLQKIQQSVGERNTFSELKDFFPTGWLNQFKHRWRNPLWAWKKPVGLSRTALLSSLKRLNWGAKWMLLMLNIFFLKSQDYN